MSGGGSSFFQEGDGVEPADAFCSPEKCFEACIDMYPYCEWEAMTAKLRGELNFFDRKHVAFWREFHRGTQEVELDGNGRVLLSRRMLEDVGVDKDMIFAAQDSVIQIWNPQAYEAVTFDGDALGQIAEEIFKKQ